MSVHYTVSAGRSAAGPRNALVGHHPAAAFVLIGISAAWVAMAIPIVTGLAAVPVALLTSLGLLGLALLLTQLSDGPGAELGRLLAGVLRWRFSPVRCALILFGMPVATLAVATIAGTADLPGDWAAFPLGYVFQTMVWGALLINLWEETIWSGFLQSRLMHRHGLLIGALLTAPAFIAIHLPLGFLPGWTWTNAGCLAGWEYVAGQVILTGFVAVARWLLLHDRLDES